MTEGIKICIVLAVAALMALLLKATNCTIGYLIAVTGTVITGVFAVKSVAPILEYTSEVGNLTSETFQILIRTLGVCYITEFAASICRDTGETSLASGVELAGRVEIIVISFPLFQQLVKICTDLIK